MWKYVVHYILSSTFFLQLRTGILAPTFSCVTFQPYMLEVIILKEIYGFKIIVIQPIYGGWNLEISFNELIDSTYVLCKFRCPVLTWFEVHGML